MSLNTNKNFTDTTIENDTDNLEKEALDAGEGQSKIDDFMHNIRSCYGEWNVGQIISTLNDAGMLLVEHPPMKSLDDLIEHDAISKGLNAAVYRIRTVLLQTEAPSPRELMTIQRQFVGIIIVAAYGKCGDLLLAAATALLEHVLLPYADRHEHYDGRDMILHPLYVHVLQLLTSFCDAVGQQELAERNDRPPTEEEVSIIVDLASNVFVSSPPGTATRWLQAYLRRHRGASWLTDEDLTFQQEE